MGDFRNEMEQGEVIVYTDTWLKQIFGGFILMFIGYGLAVMGFYTFYLEIARNGADYAMFIFGIPLIIGIALLGQLGLFIGFIRPKNCIIVTNKRVALRGVNFLFRKTALDIPLNKITNITIVDFQMYSFHLHYRLNFSFTNDKGKNRFQIVIPKNAHTVAQAIQTGKV